MTNSIDQTRPADGEKWSFDHDVTRVFDDMLARSIPAHDAMRELVYDLGQRFIHPGSDIVDLGCSRGGSLAPFVENYAGRGGVRCIGLDAAMPMVTAAQARFAAEISSKTVNIRHFDLRNSLPGLNSSLILAVLTLQFVAIEYRQRVVADAYRILRPGGAMIVVEKCLGDDATSQTMFVDAYHALKRQHGYTAEQVAAKAASLEGVLVPLTRRANVTMLEREGFRVSQFWQHLNFAAWIATKPGERPDEAISAASYPKAA